jgi:hypothetical protein
MPLAQFIRAGTIYKNAANQYEKNKKRLAFVINYALTLHIIDFDEEKAKVLYGESVDLSEANPLVTRAYAFFLLGTCEPPVALNRERAATLLADGKRKDEDHSKFELAYYLYKFSCLKNPNDYRALINLALVQCLLYGENYNAEKLLRRALALGPFEDRVIEIWKFLKDRFPERQLIYNPNSRVNKIKMNGSGKKRIIHGRAVIENNSWAGWCYVDKDEYGASKNFRKGSSYWYNPADGSEQEDEPIFKDQWAIRRERSLFQEEVYGLEQYFDPLTSEYFQYQLLTDSYS